MFKNRTTKWKQRQPFSKICDGQYPRDGHDMVSIRGIQYELTLSTKFPSESKKANVALVFKKSNTVNKLFNKVEYL